MPCQVHTASTMPCTRARSLLCRVRPYPRRAGPVTSVYRLQVFVPVLADLPATLMVRARARNAMGGTEWVSSQPLALVGPPSVPAGVTIQQEAALSAAGTIATIFKVLHPLPLFTGRCHGSSLMSPTHLCDNANKPNHAHRSRGILRRTTATGWTRMSQAVSFCSVITCRSTAATALMLPSWSQRAAQISHCRQLGKAIRSRSATTRSPFCPARKAPHSLPRSRLATTSMFQTRQTLLRSVQWACPAQWLTSKRVRSQARQDPPLHACRPAERPCGFKIPRCLESPANVRLDVISGW